MFPQTPTISFFIVLSSLILCNGYIEEPLYKTNYKHYPMHHGRFIRRKHEHFGFITRANRVAPLSSSPRGTVNVDDFGAKADGRDNTEVTYHVINKKRKPFSQSKFSSVFFYSPVLNIKNTPILAFNNTDKCSKEFKFIFSCISLVQSQSLSSLCQLFFFLFRHLERHGEKHVQEGLSLWYLKIGSIVLSQSHFLVHVDPTLHLW